VIRRLPKQSKPSTQSPWEKARAIRRARGFSLAELLLAIFILGIGVISIAALFPAGITLQRQSNDDTLGPMVAESALAILRSRLSQEDFGSFADFNPNVIPYTVTPFGGLPMRLPEGDWTWMRPGFQFDDPTTPSVDEGAIDIFSHQYSRQQLGLSPFNGLQKATEMPGGWPAGTPVLWGVPYNPARYAILPSTAGADWLRARPEPRVLISQRERYWPMVSNLASGAPQRPQYVWDVMFRRFQGRVQVAVFVYRVSFAGGQPRLYTVAPANPADSAPDAPAAANRSPLPIIFAPPATTSAWLDPRNATPPVTNVDPTIVPLTNANSTPALDLTKPRFMWQAPGQWILDQNSNVHRVLNGRRVNAEGPVKLARPIPAMPPLPAYGASPIFPFNPVHHLGVAQAWFLPLRDAAGVTITPVYLLVEEL
jgi:hypothetical protein